MSAAHLPVAIKRLLAAAQEQSLLRTKGQYYKYGAYSCSLFAWQIQRENTDT